MNMLDELRKRNKELQTPVTVNVALLKAALAEIESHVAVNGKGLLTDMVINGLKLNIERAK